MSNKQQHGEQEHVLATRRRKAIPLRMARGRWGVNSTEGINSPEWKRRHRCYGFHEKESA